MPGLLIFAFPEKKGRPQEAVCFRDLFRAGCSSARLECWSGGPEAGGSNPLIPTKVFEGHSARAEWLFHCCDRRMQRIRKGVAMKKPKAVGCGLQKH